MNPAEQFTCPACWSRDSEIHSLTCAWMAQRAQGMHQADWVQSLATGYQSNDSPTLPNAWQGIPRPALPPDEAKALFKAYRQSTWRRRLRAWLTRNFGL